MVNLAINIVAFVIVASAALIIIIVVLGIIGLLGETINESLKNPKAKKTFYQSGLIAVVLLSFLWILRAYNNPNTSTIEPIQYESEFGGGKQSIPNDSYRDKITAPATLATPMETKYPNAVVDNFVNSCIKDSGLGEQVEPICSCTIIGYLNEYGLEKYYVAEQEYINTKVMPKEIVNSMKTCIYIYSL